MKKAMFTALVAAMALFAIGVAVMPDSAASESLEPGKATQVLPVPYIPVPMPLPPYVPVPPPPSPIPDQSRT